METTIVIPRPEIKMFDIGWPAFCARFEDDFRPINGHTPESKAVAVLCIALETQGFSMILDNNVFDCHKAVNLDWLKPTSADKPCTFKFEFRRLEYIFELNYSTTRCSSLTGLRDVTVKVT